MDLPRKEDENYKGNKYMISEANGNHWIDRWKNDETKYGENDEDDV